MSVIKQAKEFKNDFILKNPTLKDDVDGLFELMLNEIEEGGSPDNELYLFTDSCEQLLTN